MPPLPEQHSRRPHERSRRPAKPLPRPPIPQDLPPTLTVEQAAEILDCGESLAYDLIRRDEFPCPVVRLGNRRYVIPTVGLLRIVGIAEKAPEHTDQ